MIAAIASFFGFIIRIIYNLVNQNYFLSILLFTLLTKIILFPLAWMQIKSTEKMQKITPMAQKIQEKYKNDKQKQSEELTKLYSENKINPMGGCLPLIIQIPILFAMFAIVRQPLTYIAQVPTEQIVEYGKEVLQNNELTEKEAKQQEIYIAKEKGIIDMDIGFGVNMGDTPSNIFSKDESKKASKKSIIIPIIAMIFSFISIKVSQKNSEMSDEQKEMQKSMNFTMPLMSGIIAYSSPVALGVYWAFGSMLQIIQQLVISTKIKSDKKKETLALNKGGN